MTQYYVDADNGNNGNDGLGTGAGNAWADVHQFTENTRSAGDICTVRRGTTAAIDDATDLDFTSDGTMVSPITLEADYDDAWSDFSNSAQTYTMVFGSKTHEASASITGIAAGDWIYNNTDSDDPREFSYEVASVSGTTLTLHLPYKGSTGATKTLKVMPDAPIWSSATATVKVNNINDLHWNIQGIEFRGNSTNGIYGQGSTSGIVIKDCIFTGNSANHAIQSASATDFGDAVFRKIRTASTTEAFNTVNTAFIDIYDSELIGSSESFQIGTTSATFNIVECEIDGPVDPRPTNQNGSTMNFRNCIFGATEFTNRIANDWGYGVVNSQDHDGIPGNSYRTTRHSDIGNPLLTEETTTVRSGGSNTSIKFTPTANSDFAETEYGKVKLLELPIYATTVSKTYEIYMRPTLTTDWTTDPTASELWLELEAWGHATNNFRKITKSTGVIDMNGSTAWQALSVTVAPAQAGVAFLRLWYAKPVEASKANSFFIDPKPVIT